MWRLICYREGFEITERHKQILEERLKEADNATDEGTPWQEVISGIKRKNA